MIADTYMMPLAAQPQLAGRERLGWEPEGNWKGGSQKSSNHYSACPGLVGRANLWREDVPFNQFFSIACWRRDGEKSVEPERCIREGIC